jgi:hypothetical protein
VEVVTNRESHHFYLNVANDAFACYETKRHESAHPSISLLCKCRFAEQFEGFALKTVFSLLYLKDCVQSWSCSPDRALLLNIPKTSDRFRALSELLFPKSHTHIFTSHVEGEGVNAAVDATLICAAADQRPNSFLFFSFSDGFSDQPNSEAVHDLLSSVDQSFSLLPDPGAIGGPTIERLPFVSFALLLNQKSGSFWLFVNGNGADALSLRSPRSVRCSGKNMPMRRTGAAQRHVAQLAAVTKSVEAITGGAAQAGALWRGCCRLTALGNRARDGAPQNAPSRETTPRICSPWDPNSRRESMPDRGFCIGGINDAAEGPNSAPMNRRRLRSLWTVPASITAAPSPYRPRADGFCIGGNRPCLLLS